MQTLGYKEVGTGEQKVIVLHNWFGDCSTYDAMIPFLDTDKCTFVFADLRGYGMSKELKGEFTLEEAVKDVVFLANYLNIENFHLIGHSMSGMVAQKIAIDHSDRVKSVVAITATPACGAGMPQEFVEFWKSAIDGNLENATNGIGAVTNNIYGPVIRKKMVEQWEESSTKEARLAYFSMFNENDFSSEANGNPVPMLVIGTTNDVEGSIDRIAETFTKWYPNAKVHVIEGSGHFPMVEMPVATADAINNYFCIV